jgi:hypothetical protein
MRADTARAARKKLLLLEGALHRLELMQARESLVSSVAGSAVGRGLPGVLSFLLRHKAGTLLASALPLLMGGSRLSRIARRGALLVGAGAALLGLFSRRQRGMSDEKRPVSDDAAVAENKTAGEKNPGQGRD